MKIFLEGAVIFMRNAVVAMKKKEEVVFWKLKTKRAMIPPQRKERNRQKVRGFSSGFFLKNLYVSPQIRTKVRMNGRMPKIPSSENSWRYSLWVCRIK